MHELQVAVSLLEMVAEEAGKNGIREVTEVRVRVGASSGVVPEALEFAFEAARQGGPAEGARLVLEKVEARGFCRECGEPFRAFPFRYTCPACFGLDIEVEDPAQDLFLMSIEGE